MTKHGPGPIPPSLVRSLEYKLRRRLHGTLSGEHRAIGRTGGTELAVVRPYVAGDDVRTIDWNVTARTGEPHIREPLAERTLTSWVLLDVSGSMTFGTADRRKWDVAEGVATVCAHLGSRRGNRVGVIAFGGPRPFLIAPKLGRGGLLGVLRAVRDEPDVRAIGATDLASALRRASKVARRGALVAVVSDFRSPTEWHPALGELSSRHDVLAIEIRDPRELEIPAVGHLWLVDPETERQVLVDTASRRLRNDFAHAAAEERASVTAAIARAGAAHVVVSTDRDWLRQIASHFRRGRVGSAS